MGNQNNDEKVYLSKAVRFIIQQEIGAGKLFEKLREKYRVKILKDNEETIILVEEKKEEI